MTTPNMGLTKPTVASDADTWGTKLNSDLDLLDSHDHTTGKGVQIVTSAIDINADLTFAGNNATHIKSTRFTNQSSALATASDVLCLFSYNNELYWNSSGGSNVKLTAGTAINAAGIATNVYSVQSISGNLTIGASDVFDLILVNTAAARQITLPLASAVAAGRRYLIKDITGTAQTNNITVARSGSDTIEGVSGNKTYATNYGSFQLVGDGTSAWYMV